MVFYLRERAEEESAPVDDLSFGKGTPCRAAAYLNKGMQRIGHTAGFPLMPKRGERRNP